LYRRGWRSRHRFSLGLHTTVFQAKIYDITACIKENRQKGYTHTNICIISNSQEASKNFDSFLINSKLF
jgi:hypothetical protein